MPSPTNDRIPILTVVVSIALGFFVSLVATIIFGWVGKELPASIGHLMDVSFGALATMLAQTQSRNRSADDPPTEVTVTQPHNNPIPVEQADPQHALNSAKDE